MPQVAALLLALPRLARLPARGQQPPPPVPRPAPRPPPARAPRPQCARSGAGRQGEAGRGGGVRGRGRPVRGRGGAVQRQPVTLRVVAHSSCSHLVTQSSCHTVILSHSHNVICAKVNHLSIMTYPMSQPNRIYYCEDVSKCCKEKHFGTIPRVDFMLKLQVTGTIVLD